MMKEEFEKLYEEKTGFTLMLPESTYKEIEFVYNFHPSISETNGKDQMVRLYEEFGMAIIRDMTPRAQMNHIAEAKVQRKRFELEEAQRMKEELISADLQEYKDYYLKGDEQNEER